MGAQFQQLPDGYLAATCPATGQRVRLHPDHAGQFQAECAQATGASPHHYPIGDAVARVTGALGIKPCAPCQQRQAYLNRLIRR